MVVKETPSSASGKGESGGWTQVKEKRRPSARLGAKATSTLRTVIPRRSVIVFATRFSPDVSVDDVKEVLQDSFTDVGSIEKLASKHASYASFKVTLSFEGISYREALECALNVEKWPQGLWIRKYFEPRSTS